jgi:hypothetical protein
VQADTEDLDFPVLAVPFPCEEAGPLGVEGQGPIGLAWVRVVVGEKLPVVKEVEEYQEALRMVDTEGLGEHQEVIRGPRGHTQDLGNEELRRRLVNWLLWYLDLLRLETTNCEDARGVGLALLSDRLENLILDSLLKLLLQGRWLLQIRRESVT